MVTMNSIVCWRIAQVALLFTVAFSDEVVRGESKGQPKIAERDYCGPGWRRFRDGCYKLFQIPRKSFKNAHSSCASMNATVAEINSNAEAEYLLDTFGGPDLRRSPWIRLMVQKAYGWGKGEALAARLVHVNKKNIGVFENTTAEAPYICERQSFQVCWEGWKETGSRCFKYFSTRKDFLSAEAVCRKHNSHLASIHSKEEFHRLMKYVRRTYRYYGVWIGLSVNNRRISWTDKSSSNYKPPSRLCSRRGSLYRGKLVRQYRTRKHPRPFKGVCYVKAGKEPFFCERAKGVGRGSLVPKTLVCKRGWKKFGDHCYGFFKKQLHFTEAEEFCHKHKAHLASINSKEEFNFLKNHYKHKFPARNLRKRIFSILKHGGVVGPWTGAVLHGGKLSWTDGSSAKFRPPFEWSSRRIPTGHDNDNLIIVAKKNKKLKLSFVNSHKKFPFFCEGDPRKPFVAYPNKGKEKATKCDEGWVKSGTFCYKYFPRPLSFARAEMECTFHAGHLTSINSKEEYELVNKMIPNKHLIMNAWVGMKTWKDKNGAHWVWTDGGADSYKFKHAIDGVPRGADVARLLKYKGQPQGAFDTTMTHTYPFVLCEEQWQHFDGGCYRLFLNRRPFLDAEADCHRYNSHLASMNSDAEYEFLRDMYRGKQHLGQRILNLLSNKIEIVGPWVGIVIHDANKVHFSWTDGSTTLYKPELHRYKMIHKGRNKHPVAKLAKVRHFLLWPEDMKKKMPYICEKKVGERRKNDIGSKAISRLRRLLQRIDENLHKVATKSPRYIKKSRVGRPKHPIKGATTTSRTKMKMTLPPITTEETTTTTTFTTTPVVTTTKSTTTTTATTPTTNPTPLVTTTQSRRANVQETSQPQRLKVKIATSTAPARVTPQRPSNWTLFRNHLYGCIREKLSFDDAEKRCLKYGSHLVSIHSKEEYELVVRLIPHTEHYPQAWIGMRVHHSATGETSFTWTDGTKDNYKALPMKLDGRPVGANAARVVLTRARPLGMVHDTKGTSKYYFVCRAVEVTK